MSEFGFNNKGYFDTLTEWSKEITTQLPSGLLLANKLLKGLIDNKSLDITSLSPANLTNIQSLSPIPGMKKAPGLFVNTKQ